MRGQRGADNHAGERLLGLTLDGNIFTFAKNNANLTEPTTSVRVLAGNYRQAEWAGACYSPDGKWLFVNIQTPGITFAITGPWGGARCNYLASAPSYPAPSPWQARIDQATLDFRPARHRRLRRRPARDGPCADLRVRKR